MALREWIAGRIAPPPPRVEPRLGSVMAGNTISVISLDDPALRELLSGGGMTHSGASVTRDTAMKVAVAWRSVSIICTVMAGLPLDLMLRENERSRKPAVGNAFRDVLTVKPNRWQTPGEFKRLQQTGLLLKGNAYAYKRTLGGEIRELLPLDPDRMEEVQNDDLSLTYTYTQRNGSRTTFKQDEIFHLRGLSLDGVTGLSVIRHAAESMGLSIQAEKSSAKLFRSGNFRSGAYKTGTALSDAAYARLKSDLGESRGVDADESGGTMILEEGLEWQSTALSAEDMQFLQLRGFTRTDVGMFFGVPPFLYGDTEKSTSWGTGIEQQNIGFLQYTIQHWITVWEEAIKRDCLAGGDSRLYAHFDPKGFFRMDAATRKEWNKAALGHGGGQPWETLNEVRAVEELPPLADKWADEIPRVVPQAPKPGTQSNDNPPTT
jgi:HK97 family phage portal protein